MILVIDNYDSFVHNLARHLRQLGAETRVVRNDALSLEAIEALAPDRIVISPGPCTPREAGISNPAIERFAPELPILGVCLGHQCIAEVFGARVERAAQPRHGKATPIHHDGTGIFAGIPSPFPAAHYHSLTVARDSLPDELEAVAFTTEGEVMALRHRVHATWGVQFHPESILTAHGYDLLRAFLRLPVPARAGVAR